MKPHEIAHRQCIILFSIACVLLSACTSGAVTTSSVTVTPSLEPEINWLQVYFTDPASPHARDYEGGPDEALAAAIDKAHLSVDVAAYSLNLWSVRNALINAYKRGVVVRMVMESDNMDDEEVQDLLDAGIPVVGDEQEGLMHDKFVVIDRSEVWTGSMNYTVSSAYKDNNNLICVRSEQVAQVYTSEFEEMFVDGFFGSDESDDAPNTTLVIDDTPVEIYFSPDDGVAERIIELIGMAQESIYFMAYSFTSNEIGEAIISRAQNGITVAGVMDEEQIAYGEGTEYDSFKQADLDVRLDGNDGSMHHKVIIIDRQIVITGSYNFSANAEESNDENVVIIFNSDVAVKFLEEFQRVYDLAPQSSSELPAL